MLLIAMAALFVLNIAALLLAAAKSPVGCERHQAGFTSCLSCSDRSTCRQPGMERVEKSATERAA